MTPLPLEFNDRGFAFHSLGRDGLVAMYRKTRIGGQATTFEVVLTRQAKAHTWPNGTTTPAHETMPSAEQWGVYGWTYTTREAAGARFGKLVAAATAPRMPRVANNGAVAPLLPLLAGADTREGA